MPPTLLYRELDLIAWCERCRLWTRHDRIGDKDLRCQRCDDGWTWRNMP